jgi:hypothetical protein
MCCCYDASETGTDATNVAKCTIDRIAVVPFSSTTPSSRGSGYVVIVVSKKGKWMGSQFFSHTTQRKIIARDLWWHFAELAQTTYKSATKCPRNVLTTLAMIISEDTEKPVRAKARQ